MGWPGEIYTRIGTRGEPFDLAVSTGWCSDYHDPWNWIFLYDGTTIHDVRATSTSPTSTIRSSTNGCTRRKLIGDERSDAFQQIEHDLVRDAAPSAPSPLQQPLLLLAADGCQHYQSVYGIDLAQLCMRPEVTTDDAVTSEPVSGTTDVHVPSA